MLVCLAHPDDETFGMGGTLALYARRGVQVHLVCATRGEVGDVDPELMQGFSTIAERREIGAALRRRYPWSHRHVLFRLPRFRHARHAR